MPLRYASFLRQTTYSDFQFGFRENRGTTEAIGKILEQIYENFNSRKITQGVFLDFSKAFDTIDHGILIQKLKFYNFSTESCDLLGDKTKNLPRKIEKSK